MVSKKLKLLFTLCMFVSAFSFAQTTGNTGYMNGGYSIYDSSVIPTKRMGQQNEFWNNSYSFPAKPRNMWEIGVSTGLFTISGDVSTVPLTAPNFGIHIRKSFGYVFSLRLQYINTVGKGQNWKASDNFYENEAWSYNGYYAPYRTPAGPITNVTVNPLTRVTTTRPGSSNDIVYYNYKTKLQDLSLQGIFTVNNIRFHKSKTGIIIYGGGGIGGTLYNTRINALDANNKPYAAQFAAIQSQYGGGDVYKNRKAIRSALKSAMDDTYETQAESHRNPNAGALGVRPGVGDKTFKPSGTVLAGVAFKLGRRINLAIEDRWTFVKDDLLDGQRWQEQAVGSPVQTRDFDSYNYASLGLNFNLGGKSTEPLYWLNPMDYAYSELNNPKHMKLPKSECTDSDGDGVCDFLDNEVTPAGCPVDTHGVTRDTDGDGVPDCKDKQLITPTECQPVDADGIGKCPVKCCDNPVTKTEGCPTDYPSLSFKGNSCALSGDNKSMLAAIASKMKSNPSCSITITGYPETSKAAQANCNCRMDAIKKELVEKAGISADRISTNCEVGDGANKNTVDIKSN
jgi:outer membrane protein OmpA-like peptidoglycan-associated protein